jgi:hypothetical protein
MLVHRPSLPTENVSGAPWLKPRSLRRFEVVRQQLTVSLSTTATVVGGIFALWLLGKLSWNHDPQVSQAFQPASLVTLTNRPQNAALEFHHALSIGSFPYAKSLVSANSTSLVDEARAACSEACPTPEQSRDTIFTRASLLETNGRSATALAESFNAKNELLRRATYELIRENERWLIVARTPE